MQIFELFFYLTILLLPTQLGLHFWPDWTLVLGRRVDYLAPTIFLTDITILLTLLTWCIQKNARLTIAKTIHNHALLLGISTLFVAGNIYFSSNPIVSLYKWSKVIEYAAFFYFIYTTKPSLKKTVYCFAAAVFYSSCIAITQFSLQHTIGGIFWFLGERTFSIDTSGIAKMNWCWMSKHTCIELIRPYATFPHPNILGGFFGTTIPLLILVLKKEKKKYIRIALMLCIALGVFTLGLTFSRSAWIIGGCVIFGAFLLSAKKSRDTYIAGGVGLAIALFIALPYISTLNSGNESVFMRLDLAQAAIDIIIRHPLTGTGLGTFLVALPYVVNIRDLFFLQPVHNIYLLFLSETGVFGIVCLGIAIILYIQALKRIRPMMIITLPLIAMSLLGLLDHYPTTLQQGQLLTTCVLAIPFLKANS